MVNQEQQHPDPTRSAKSPQPSTGDSLCDSVAKVATEVGTAIAESATQAGKAAAETAAMATETLGKLATEAGERVAATAGEATQAATKQTYTWFEQATEEAGKAISSLSDHSILKPVFRLFRADWLLTLAGPVDVTKAQETVRKLQQEFPKETPSEIAHRLMVDKAIYAGGIGLVSSLLPGVAVALLAIDLVATTQLQAEMVYQIAAAYGMDLHAPARKGEVLAIFGLSLGGAEALKAGFGLLRNVPMAGAVIGASTNAVMIYTVGYAACRFYESKVNPMSSEAAAKNIQQESEAYLKEAIVQQEIVDQLLVHTILASYPDRAWSDILPELQQLNIPPASLDVIATHIHAPKPFNELLNKLQRDYAIALLARCCTISQLDCVVTEPEQKLLEAIAAKFDIDLKSFEAAVIAESTDCHDRGEA